MRKPSVRRKNTHPAATYTQGWFKVLSNHKSSITAAASRIYRPNSNPAFSSLRDRDISALISHRHLGEEKTKERNEKSTIP